MGATGSKFEFGREMDADIIRAYREALAIIRPPFSKTSVIRLALSLPAKRFWVSFERALWQVRRQMNGRPLVDVTSPQRTEMYQEIYRRCCCLSAEQPDMSLADVVETVISSPAPKFYITEDTALERMRKACKRR